MSWQLYGTDTQAEHIQSVGFPESQEHLALVQLARINLDLEPTASSLTMLSTSLMGPGVLDITYSVRGYLSQEF
jgi:hypothetical protein